MESASPRETADVYRATEIVRDEDVLSHAFQRDVEQAISPLALVLVVGLIGSWARRSKAVPATALSGAGKSDGHERARLAGDGDA